ncbi:hypothetical protein QBC46DRAFT_120369 [Diplogelasinospora grovesii]|uniref:Transmembrane protein n=1 Tax=Diplogelasinospora grovesii TaxID=303347 RepID=A0AAN6S514_9PEZI|nr:hypothetical protein QBC46DRAFT_120369 [Diplogelasinospora grovesii]
MHGRRSSYIRQHGGVLHVVSSVRQDQKCFGPFRYQFFIAAPGFSGLVFIASRRQHNVGCALDGALSFHSLLTREDGTKNEALRGFFFFFLHISLFPFPFLSTRLCLRSAICFQSAFTVRARECGFVILCVVPGPGKTKKGFRGTKR